MMRGMALAMLVLAVWMPNAYAADDAVPDSVVEARSVAMSFQGALKSELQAAMKSGGPKAAVAVCHTRAGEIAEEMSGQTGWLIGRTSLKHRNAANQPTEGQRIVLNDFEARKQAGEPVAALEWWEETPTHVAYMKAIPMKGMCAMCHGTEVSPSLREHIAELYPNDMATGFQPGDIRGAFVLQKSFGAERD